MHYKVFIKPCKKNKNIEFVSGGISDGTGQDESNSYAKRSDYIPSVENNYYTVTILHGLGVNMYMYDTNKNYLGKVDLFSRSALVSNKKPYETSIRSYRISEYTYANTKYIRFVIIRDETIKSEYLTDDSFGLYEKQKSYLIHDPFHPNKNKILCSPNLSLSDSSSGSFSFEMVSTHEYHKNGINILTDTFYIVRVYDDYTEKIIWDGRPISVAYDWNKTISVYCEGALSYLNDTKMRWWNGRYLEATVYGFISGRPYKHGEDETVMGILPYHNSVMDMVEARQDRTMYYDIDRSVTNGTDFAVNSKSNESSVYVNRGEKQDWWTNFEGCLFWIVDTIIGAFGGHLKLRYNENDTVDQEVIQRRITLIQKFDFTEYIDKYTSNKMYYKGSIVARSVAMYSDIKIYEALKNTYSIPGQDATAWKEIYSEKDNGDYIVPREYADIENVDGTSTERCVVRPIDYRFASAKVNFGQNLLNYSKEITLGDLATVVIPRGEQVDSMIDNGLTNYIYLDTARVKNPDYDPDAEASQEYINVAHLDTPYYYDDELMSKYGIIEACVDFDQVKTPMKLLEETYKWFRNVKKSLLKEIVNVEAVILARHITPSISSDPFCDGKYVDLWTKVYVTSEPFDLHDEIYYVTAMDIPLDNPAGTTVTLTSKNELLTDSRINNGLISGSSGGIIDRG